MDLHIPHMQRLGRTYYFRLPVPPDLRALFGCRELKRSLRTGNPVEAMPKCLQLTRRFTALFAEVRMSDIALSDKTTDEIIQHIVRDIYHETLANDALERSKESFRKPEDIEWEQMRAVANLREARDVLLQASGDFAPDTMTEILDPYGLLEDPRFHDYSSPGMRKLIHALLRTYLEIAKVVEARSRGDYSNAFDRLEFERTIMTPATADPSPTPAGPPRPTSKSLAQLSELYIADHLEKKEWKRQAEFKARQVIRIMEEVLGSNTPVAEISHDELMRLRDEYLRKMPVNLEKKREKASFRGKALHEIVALPKVEHVSETTFRGYVTQVCMFFNWCHKRNFIPQNPSGGLLPRKPKSNPADERKQYTLEHLRSLLTALCTHERPSGPKPERFWVPLIALFSGMRQNEICQLHLDDVGEVDGVPCFKVREDTPDKSVKTAAGIRDVPVHRFLIERGFLGYVEGLRRRKQTMLWPGLKKGRDGYGRAISAWFNKFNDKHVTDDPKVDFHSLRHTVVTALHHAQVPPANIKALVGHENSDVTSGRYTKLSAEDLKTDLEKIDFGVELNAFAWPRMAEPRVRSPQKEKEKDSTR